jgi:uncharacterized membrane protein YbaN (DUF454 family)
VPPTDLAGVRQPPTRSRWARIGLGALGLLFLGLGFAGFVVPGLPGTPLLLVAAWLFSMSNDRLYGWMLTNRWFGEVVSDYRAGLGITRRMKWTAVVSMSVVIALSITFGFEDWRLKGLLAALGAVGVWFILSRPTRLVSGEEPK